MRDDVFAAIEFIGWSVLWLAALACLFGITLLAMDAVLFFLDADGFTHTLWRRIVGVCFG